MDLNEKIYIAGHRGLVGKAIVRQLKSRGFCNLITRTHEELDLTNQSFVNDFFNQEKPQYVILAAGKVGGIYANNTYPAEFIFNNIMIEANVIHASYQSNVKRLLFLGSTCIYPKVVEQPMCEDALLTNVLESTIFQKLRDMEIKDGFEESSTHSLFFRKGKSEQWKKILSKNQINLIEKKLQIPMEYLEYK